LRKINETFKEQLKDVKVENVNIYQPSNIQIESKKPVRSQNKLPYLAEVIRLKAMNKLVANQHESDENKTDNSTVMLADSPGTTLSDSSCQLSTLVTETNQFLENIIEIPKKPNETNINDNAETEVTIDQLEQHFQMLNEGLHEPSSLIKQNKSKIVVTQEKLEEIFDVFNTRSSDLENQ
jgi:hypothetical protein